MVADRRSERNRRAAISALRRPSATSASTSSSRAVSPLGFSRVAACGPWRRSAHPSARRRARRSRRYAGAPSRCSSSRPRRRRPRLRCRRAPARTHRGSRARPTASPPAPARRRACARTALPRRPRRAARRALRGAATTRSSPAPHGCCCAASQIEHDRRLEPDQMRLTSQPARLRAGERHGQQALQLAGGRGERSTPRRAASTDRGRRVAREGARSPSTA